MRAIENHDQLELVLLVGASAIISRYGEVVKLIKKMDSILQVHLIC